MNTKIIFGGVLLSIIIVGLFIKREKLEGFSSCKVGCKAPSNQTGNCTYLKLADGTFDKTKLSCPWYCENKAHGNEDSTQCMYDSDCAGCLPATLFNNIIGSTGTFNSTISPVNNNLGNSGPDYSKNMVSFINSNIGNTGAIDTTNTTAFDSDLYMLKSSYVPPICPAYPTPFFHKKKKQHKHTNKNTNQCVNQDKTQIYSYDDSRISNIPLPVLPDFTTYGM